MAQWTGTARSNYVKIKDMDGLKEALETFEIEIAEGHSMDTEGKVCFLSHESDSGGWPISAYNEVDDAEMDFDPAVQICPFMEEGQVLVMQEAGAERMRYVTGSAQAYNSKGEMVSINIDAIYKMAAKKFGVKYSDITLAQY